LQCGVPPVFPSASSRRRSARTPNTTPADSPARPAPAAATAAKRPFVSGEGGAAATDGGTFNVPENGTLTSTTPGVVPTSTLLVHFGFPGSSAVITWTPGSTGNARPHSDAGTAAPLSSTVTFAFAPAGAVIKSFDSLPSSVAARRAAFSASSGPAAAP